MKKYLISTLTAAAALSVPAFSAELIGSWDFSTATIEDGTIKSSVAYDTDKYLYITTGGSISSDALTINPSSNGHTTIDTSNANVTLTEGISIVMTVTGLSTGTSGSGRVNIWASIMTESSTSAAFIGENGSAPSSGSNLRQAGFAAGGSDQNVTITQDGYVDLSSYPITLTLTFVGNTLSLYEGGTLIAQATIDADTYSLINGTITGVAIGSWDIEGNNNNTFGSFTISSVDVYSGDVMAAPEPSMFGLLFGLGTIGLVATRRRRKVA